MIDYQDVLRKHRYEDREVLSSLIDGEFSAARWREVCTPHRIRRLLEQTAQMEAERDAYRGICEALAARNAQLNGRTLAGRWRKLVARVKSAL